MKKSRTILMSALVFIATACRTGGKTPEASDTAGLGAPTSEGVPIQFVSDLPAGVARELYRNLAELARASSPTGRFSDIQDLPFSMTCHNFSGDETRCRLVYSGPEIKLKVAEFLFQTMAGNITLARGCTGSNCKNPFKVWWRTKPRREKGKQLYDFEVCQIKGLEASVATNERFAVLGNVMDSMVGQPHIHGFSVTIEEISRLGPKYEPNGTPVLDSTGKQELELKTDYRVIAAQAGLGPIGNFPHPGCNLSDDNPSDVVANARRGMGQDLGNVPPGVLESAPGRLVKVAMDVNAYVGKTSSGQAMKFNMRCQPRSDQPVCEMRYQGPPVTFPIPAYVTGIFDGAVEFLRPCRNPGCRQYDEVNVKLAAYAKDGLEHIEVCSIQGAELFTKARLPWQERIIGMPDLKGIKLAMDPGPGRDDPADPISRRKPVLKEFYMGVSNIGPFPTPNCEFKQ